jgi:hypothetical protein
MRRISNQVTRSIVLNFGDRFPMFVIAEYPKSGGTWLGRMVADVLRVPFPRHTCMPLAMTCVVHNHWKYDARLGERTIYLYRDGRDVMASFYFHRMRWIASGAAHYRKRAREYERLLGKGYDPADTKKHMARFIEHEFATPRDCRQNWRDHLGEWFGPGDDAPGRPAIAYVSYELLRGDCATHLARICEKASGKQPDPWLVEHTVEKWSMERTTGRRPGEEDRGDLVRKGVAGDWVNHFNREAAEVFDRLAGDMLVRLGYEADRGWVDRYQL